MRKYKKVLINSILITIFGVFMVSCGTNKTMIAISKASSSQTYENYKNAILHYDSTIEVVDLWAIRDNHQAVLDIIRKANGLILSGGPDIDPVKYGRAEDSSQCTIDIHRDSLEFELINQAVECKIPILGICRGLQILNVAFGGSLIVDIPSEIMNYDVHQLDSGDSYHIINIIEPSLLHSLVNLKSYEVNSNHHQAIDRLANNLRATAIAKDNIIESVEYKDKDKPYLMAVQWHPERMPLDSTMSKAIFTNFIKECKKNR